MTTLDERLQQVVFALRFETAPGLGEQLDEFCDRMTGLAAAVHEARALLKANLTPGFICGCGIFNGDVRERRKSCRACGAGRP